MQTSSRTTTRSVCSRRRVVSSGISALPLPFAGRSADTPWTLPARQALQPAQGAGGAGAERLDKWLPAPDDGDQSGPGEQVGDVMLAEVDEGEAEGAGIGPPDRALDLADFGQRERGDQRGGEVQRGHRRPGVAAERVVHLRPGRAPGLLADLDHDPPHLFAGQALLRGPPGRRRRDREVDGTAEVEDGRHLAGGAREALVVANQDQRQRHVRLEEPEPVGPGEDAVEDADAGQASETALETGVRQLAGADDAVANNRVMAAETAAQALGVVERELMDHDESPHLHRVERDVALVGAGEENSQRERPTGTGGDGDRGRDAQAAPRRGNRDGGAEDAHRTAAHEMAKRG